MQTLLPGTRRGATVPRPYHASVSSLGLHIPPYHPSLRKSSLLFFRPTTRATSSANDNDDTTTGKQREQQQQQQDPPPSSSSSSIDTTSTSQNEEQQQKTLIMGLSSLPAAIIELARLLIFIPTKVAFSILVLSPLAWIIERMGLLKVNAEALLEKLEEANNASPVSADRVAETLRKLNNMKTIVVRSNTTGTASNNEGASSISPSSYPSKPTSGGHIECSDVVVDFVEKRILSPPSDPTTQKPFAANAAVVREYIAALVKTGRLDTYGNEKEAVAAGGALTASQSHRSLPKLLDQLKQLAGQDDASFAEMISQESSISVGMAATRPLHVYVSGSGNAVLGGGGGTAGAAKPPALWTALQSFFWFWIGLSLFSMVWGLGTSLVKRPMPGTTTTTSSSSFFGGSSGLGGVPSFSSSTNGPMANQPMMPPGGIFAPKEYNKENMPEKSVKTFKDVKGCKEAVQELEEIVEYLKNPDKFTKLGGKLPKGVLLTGPPGTGKTLLAKAVAGEAGVPFFFKAGSEFDEMFVGVGSRRVRSLFAAAKKKAPCIVFIDEVDAVGGKRTSWEASGGSRKTLNQLLTEMDGFEENSGVVVMAATNLPETLDSALTRPGRFDRQVAVPLPDVKGREDILSLYLTGKPVSKDVSIHNIARRTPGFSGAQLFNLINEGALLAARHGMDSIDAAVLDEARDKILMGSPRALIQTEKERKLTAYHEGGHALVALHTPGARPIHKATIIPRGHALGMVSQLPEGDEYSVTRQQLMATIDVCMGGKAAEELIFGEDYVTSGATSDLRQATRTARHMVQDCGMSSEIGPVAIGLHTSDDGRPIEGTEVRETVDREVSKLLKGAYGRVKMLLKEKKHELHKIAGALLEKETLTLAEIRELLGMEPLVEMNSSSSNSDVGVEGVGLTGTGQEGGSGEALVGNAAPVVNSSKR